MVVLGTTSESSTLSDDEKDEIVRFVINKNASRMKIVVAVITNSSKDAIEKSIRYEKMGADYLLVISPFYNKTNKNGLIKHFNVIAQNINIPIIIYNVPSRSGMNIDVDVILELKKTPNIVGVKECSKDIAHIIELSKICDRYFHLYCGNDDLSYLFLSLGATGLINVYGNVNPKLMKDLINIYEINPLLARNYFYEFYDLFKVLFIETNPIPIKALMNYLGHGVGLYRMPLEQMMEENYNKLINLYKKVNRYHTKI